MVAPGKLAASFAADRPGLPRGRSSLPAEMVREAQRDRLLRAVMAAVAERGYAAVTVRDVVARARVSRKAFYEHFADKEECFLAAAVAGAEVMVDRVVTATRADPADRTPMSALRHALRAYLQLCDDEPEFARCLLVELLAAGPRALELRNAGYDQLATLFRTWHAAARERHPAWPPAPDEAYPAAVGAVHELVFRAVTEGGAVPALEDVAVELVLRVLAVPTRAEATG